MKLQRRRVSSNRAGAALPAHVERPAGQAESALLVDHDELEIQVIPAGERDAVLVPPGRGGLEEPLGIGLVGPACRVGRVVERGDGQLAELQGDLRVVRARASRMSRVRRSYRLRSSPTG